MNGLLLSGYLGISKMWIECYDDLGYENVIENSYIYIVILLYCV